MPTQNSISPKPEKPSRLEATIEDANQNTNFTYHIPAPANTKRAQERWMRYSGWEFVKNDRRSNHEPWRQDRVVFECDQSGCYDRLIHVKAFGEDGRTLDDYVSIWRRQIK